MTPQLEDQLRATFLAHASDVSAGRDLGDDARDQAVRLRRQHRARVLAGAVAVVGVVALVPWIASLGPDHQSEPPVQPVPSVSAVPVPDAVIAQARETRALLAVPTTIVDGTGPDVVTIPVAREDEPQGGINQLVYVSRAAGGYVIKLAPNLPGDMNPADAEPVSAVYVRPDGSTTLLGHPTDLSYPKVSPDGSLVAFESAGTATTNRLVVTDLAGRTLEAHDVTGPQDVLYLTATGLWFGCARGSCVQDKDNLPHYWEFSSGSIIEPPFSSTSRWVAQSGDEVIVWSRTGADRLSAFDVSAPASPVRLWTSSMPIGWGAFDGSGTRLLAGNLETSRVVLLDATTGEELDSARMGSIVAMTWNPDQRWLAYVPNDDDLSSMRVTALTPGADGSLSVTRSTYPPYDPPGYRGPTYAAIGQELPPPH